MTGRGNGTYICPSCWSLVPAQFAHGSPGLGSGEGRQGPLALALHATVCHHGWAGASGQSSLGPGEVGRGSMGQGKAGWGARACPPAQGTVRMPLPWDEGLCLSYGEGIGVAPAPLGVPFHPLQALVGGAQGHAAPCLDKQSLPGCKHSSYWENSHFWQEKKGYKNRKGNKHNHSSVCGQTGCAGEPLCSASRVLCSLCCTAYGDARSWHCLGLGVGFLS